MLFIFSTPVLIRHLWQFQTVVFLRQCLMSTVLLKCSNGQNSSADSFVLIDHILTLPWLVRLKLCQIRQGRAWPKIYKAFYFHNLGFFVISQSGSLSSLILYLRLRLRVYSIMEHLAGALLSMLLALLANIRLGQKGFPGTNTLAYYEDLKSFVTLGPGVEGIKTF